MLITNQTLKEIFKRFTGRDMERQLSWEIDQLTDNTYKFIPLSEIEDRPVKAAFVFRHGDEYSCVFLKSLNRQTGQIDRNDFYSVHELSKVLFEEGLASFYQEKEDSPGEIGPLSLADAKNLLFGVIGLNYSAELKRGAIKRIWNPDDNNGNPRKHRI